MAPRGQVLPQAATDSARDARRAFFCELCQKGYARQNEFEAHEGSYDHQHRKRLKEMRMLTKDPNAAARARAAEQKANEQAGLKSVSISLTNTGAPKKKPVFKAVSDTVVEPTVIRPSSGGQSNPLTSSGTADDMDFTQAKPNGWHDSRYQPHILGLDPTLPSGGRRPRDTRFVIDTSTAKKWTEQDEKDALSEIDCEHWYEVDVSSL